MCCTPDSLVVSCPYSFVFCFRASGILQNDGVSNLSVILPLSRGLQPANYLCSLVKTYCLSSLSAASLSLTTYFWFSFISCS